MPAFESKMCHACGKPTDHKMFNDPKNYESKMQCIECGIVMDNN